LLTYFFISCNKKLPDLKRLLITKVFLNIFIILAAQDAAMYDFSIISMEEGLLSRSVNSICQDKTGFIWIATRAGLQRYDGKSFITYETDTNLSIPASNINSVFCDSKNRIWIAGNSLVCLNQQTNQYTCYVHNPDDSLSIGNSTINAIYEDRKENIWIGHWSGVSRIDANTGKIKNYFFNENLFRSICEDNDGNMWFGTFRMGVYKLDVKTGSFTHYPFSAHKRTGIGSANIKDIFCDLQGELWFAAWGGGLQKYDKVKDSFITYPLV
jgi:ligand-binding sensor domain-containing protein